MEGSAMKKFLLVAVSLFLCTSTSNAAAAKKYLGWSMGYYCTWDHSYTPENLPWDAFTHVAHFQAWPYTNGTVSFPDAGFGKRLVTEGHKRGKKVMLCVGGAGVGDGFKYWCSNTNRGKFISMILDNVKSVGYDGIDTDWEENFDNTLYVAWHKDLRDSINKVNPKLALTVAAEDWFDITGKVSMYVDQVNDMNYSGSATQYKNTIFPKFVSLGCPKEKLGAGMGISMGNSVAMDTALASMVISNGFGGIIQWAITTKDNGTPNMTALPKYVDPNPTNILFAKNQAQNESTFSFSIKSPNGGFQEITYKVPAAYRGSNLDIGVYDVKGALVNTLSRGITDAGSHTALLNRVAAGSYVIKMSTNNTTVASKTFFAK